jgi:hypothetical protein
MGSSNAHRWETVSRHLTALLCAITFLAVNSGGAEAMPIAGTRTAFNLLAGEANKKLEPKRATLPGYSQKS